MMNSDLRALYAVRGKVVGQGVRTHGLWPFRTKVPTIRVRIAGLQEEIFTFKGIKILSPLELGLTDGKSYPDDTEVGITFGYANQVQQFFYRTEPLVVVDVQTLMPGAPLKNEISFA